jgi:hypothetical protein
MRIEVYQRRIGPPGAPTLATPTAGQAERQVGALAAEAASDLAHGLGALALGRSQAEEEAARAWTAQRLAEARLEWQRREAQAREQAPAGLQGYAQRLASEFDAWRQEVEQAAPTPGARRLLSERLGLLRASVLADAEEAERSARIDATVAQMQQSLDTLGAAVAAKPLSLPAALADMDAVLNAGALPEPLREKLRRAGAEELTRAAMLAQIQADPAGALQLLAEPGLALEPTQRARLMATARAEVEQRARAAQAEARQRAREAQYEAQIELAERLKQHEAQLKAGIVPRDLIEAVEFRRAYGDRWERRYQAYRAQVQQVRELGRFGELPLPEQRAAYAAAVRRAEETGEGAALLPAMQRILAARLEEVTRDPAGVVLGRLGQRVLEGPAAAAIRTAWDAQGAELGLPEHARRAVPEAVVRDVAARWEGATDARGLVEAVTPLFAGLHGHPAEIALARQLDRAGVPREVVYVARAAERGDWRDAELLAEVLRSKPSKLDRDAERDLADELAAQADRDEGELAARAKAQAAGPGALVELARQRDLQASVARYLIAAGTRTREAVRRAREIVRGRGPALYAEGLAAIERLPEGLDPDAVEAALDRRREELRQSMTLEGAAQLGFLELAPAQSAARAVQERNWRATWNAVMDNARWQDGPDGELWLTIQMPDGRRVRIDDPRFRANPLLLIDPTGASTPRTIPQGAP